MVRIVVDSVLVLVVVFLAGGLLGQAKPVFATVHSGGAPKKSVDVLFVGDGYTAKRKTKFDADVKRYAERMLKEPPFLWYKKRFNIRSAFVPSKDQGCDLSPKENKVKTVFESYFDSPRGRLLMFRNRRALRKLVRKAGEVDILFVMVDVQRYGGSGSVLPSVRVRGRPLAAPTFAAHKPSSFSIAIHELGHSFARLADEYVDPAAARTYRMPSSKKDLAAPNVSRKGHFDGTSFATLKETVKWREFLSLPGAEGNRWLHEGAFYRKTGLYRPWPTCKMRSNAARFCPVCMMEMSKAIVQACGDRWDAAAYHKAHPLSAWK